jgi:hypothetical protein
MPTFGAFGKSALSSDLPGPVGAVAPTPFFDAVGAGADYGWNVMRGGARGDEYQHELLRRHAQLEKRTGQKIKWSSQMFGQDKLSERMLGAVVDPAMRAIGVQQSDESYEAQVAALKADHPGALDDIESSEQILTRLQGKWSAKGQKVAEASYYRTGAAGVFVGQTGASMAEPENVGAMIATGPLGAGRSLAVRMLAQGAANAGVEATLVPQRFEDAKRFGGPQYTAGQATLDIAGAGLGAAGFEALGAGVKAGLHQLRGLRGAVSADPAMRGAFDVVETAARDDAILGDLGGAEHQLALDALSRGAPPPRLEPDRDLGELFNGGASSADYKGRTIAVESFDPATLATDPARFQYKADADAQGVTARLKGVEAWDPLAAGRVMVFEDQGGARFIADGHQRFGLISRLNDDRGFAHQLDGFLFREADGWKAQDVRVLAALKNIREGSGNPLDAAKVFRDAPQALQDRSLPVTGEFMAQARGLASLSPEAFGAVVNKVLPERYAAEIGQLADGRPDLHMDMVRLLKVADPSNGDEARALVMEALQDDWIKGEGETADLFGHDPSISAMIGRAKVAASVKRSLARDAKLFGQLVKHADAIEAGGNALARDANQARLATDRAALEVTAKLALRHGPIGEAMAEAAGRVAKGENPASAAKAVLARVREALEAGERLDETRGVALDPQAPTASGEALLKGFDDPTGEGAKAQAKAAPEDAEFEAEGPPGLFDDLPQTGGAAKARDALLACVPGE